MGLKKKSPWEKMAIAYVLLCWCFVNRNHSQQGWIDILHILPPSSFPKSAFIYSKSGNSFTYSIVALHTKTKSECESHTKTKKTRRKKHPDWFIMNEMKSKKAYFFPWKIITGFVVVGVVVHHYSNNFDKMIDSNEYFYRGMNRFIWFWHRLPVPKNKIYRK